MSLGPTGEWSALVTSALLGCERTSTLPALPPALVGIAADRDTPALRLLTQVALLSPWTLAGQPLATGGGAHPQCEPETQRPANSVSTLLAPEHAALMGEWCRMAAKGNRCVPYHLLPEFLDRLASQKSADTASAMREVLGVRGRWLAQMNTAWRTIAAPAHADPQATWESGTRAERIMLLQKIRVVDATAALGLLTSTQEVDAPDEVAVYVSQLMVGLSMADHDFLESLLDARHKPVRQAAASLLARLPQSARSARMAQWLASRVTYKPGSGFFKKGSGTIEAVLPDKEDAAAAKALSRDGIETGRKRGKLGPKAHTLLQVVASTPLTWFVSQWNASPAELIEAALSGEWAEALLLGWSDACIAQHDAAWTEALLGAFAGRAGGFMNGLEGDSLGVLFQQLPPDTRESFLLNILDERPRALHDGWLQQLLGAADHTWSEVASRRFLKVVRTHYLHETPWSLRPVLIRLGAYLAPACADGLREGWPAQAPQWTKADDTMLEHLTTTLELRRNYLQELSS